MTIGLVLLFLIFFTCSIAIAYLPSILIIIISDIAILLIHKKLVREYQQTKKKVYITIIIIACVCISAKLTPLWFNYVSARPNNTYVKMKKIDDSQMLIGLSKEQVIEFLGEPYSKKDTYYDAYYYDAGKITDYITLGEKDTYTLEVIFDEDGVVESTRIKMDA